MARNESTTWFGTSGRLGSERMDNFTRNGWTISSEYAPVRPWWSLATMVEDVTAVKGATSLQPFRHALAVSRRLPAELADRIYFEDRGARSARPMDFIVGVGDAGRKILAGENPALSLPTSLTRDPVWEGISSLAQRWSVPTDPLNRIERIWLEFDAPAPHRTRSHSGTPGVFVDLPLPDHPARSALLALDALECVVGRAFRKRGIRRSLLRLTERLPSGASLPFAAVFPSRRHTGVRVCLAGVRPGQLAALLPELGETADISGLANTLDRHWRDRFGPAPAVVHLDLAASIPPAIGLEYHLDRGRQRSGRIAEWPFLLRLQAMGLLSTDSLARCAGWPATTRLTMRHRISPSILARRVAHVKIVCRAGPAVTAKVYLAAAATSLP